MRPTSAIYTSFNARQLTPEEVADTFVAPPQYQELCRAEHTLLLGPRGSGKTTLLKMLTAPAMRAWTRRSEQPLAELPFKTVYIPADILWTSQLSDVTRQGFENSVSEALVRAAVVTNIQYSIIDTLEQLDETLADRNREALCATQIAEGWRIDNPFPSFYGLRRALRSRLASIRDQVVGLQFGQPVTNMGGDRRSIGGLGLWDAAGIAIEVIGEVYGLARSQRWALCFDELEIGPQWLRQELYEALRSTDQRFVLKLSASPLQSTAADYLRPTAAQEGQDYRVVRLWYAGAGEASDFCHRLARMVMSRAAGTAVDPHDALGRSAFAQEDGALFGRSLTYEPGSSFWKELLSASRQDPSLLALLKEWRIDPLRPRRTKLVDRDQLLRKIKPVLMLRNEFRAAGNERRQRSIRSRKRSSLYSGAEAVYALSDGNPRWLIGMLGDMLTSGWSGAPIRRDAQAGVLWRTSHRFKALLGMLPSSTRLVNGKHLALVDLLDGVGKYFFGRLIRGDFPVDPVGSFVVDSRATDALVELIEVGVTQGAIVYVDSDWKAVPASPRGKRFRLSFMLAPSYRLPLRLYEPVALSKCLEAMLTTRTAVMKASAVSQEDLFGTGVT